MTGEERVAPSGRALAKGMAWLGIYRWSGQILSWAATLLVIRLLTPADYGIMGMALAWISVASVLAEFGLGSAIIALPDLKKGAAAQLHTLALGLGVAGFLVTAAATPLIAAFFREPRLTLALPVLGLTFILESGRIVPVADLTRGLEYRRVAGIDLVRAVCTAVAVISLAVLGWGYWALIVGNLAGQGAATLLTLRLTSIGWARPVFAELDTALRYSRHILINRLAWQVYINADIMIGGRLFGVQSLGFYTVARQIASLPGEKLGNIITAASAPFFSSIQRDIAALRHYFLRITETLTIVLHPLLIGLLLVVDIALAVVIGERWVAAIPLVQILVAAAALQTIFGPVVQILNVTGQTRAGMWSSILAMGILVPSFVIGGRLAGMNGIALAWLVAFPLVISLPLFLVLRTLQISLWEYFGAWRRALEGVLVMAGAVVSLRLLLPVVHPAIELVLAVAVGAGAYLGLLWWRHSTLLTAVIRLVRPAAADTRR